ncbi:BrnT family toxin [Achromobacter aloeverae]|uniref:BrnT family toxin n=1 Tax=Achromobacter aloeverae TaxID=1750518 RepID=A0A4Q1HI80_9BURK|nr:BrnT family toxin [Achromobacter aloeverae]RXN87761.1 hypothetical protein C7R54_14270 [Achromobacter aloeverae]
MELSFDPVKDISNQRKHGVSLREAREFEWEGALTCEDLRRDYGERRMVSIGYIGPRLYVVVYVTRAGECRIISLRKANEREVKRYAEA